MLIPTWIIITYLSMMLFMTFVLIGLLEVHKVNKKVWIYVFIQPYGVMVFIWKTYRHLKTERLCRNYFSGYRVNKRFRSRWK